MAIKIWREGALRTITSIKVMAGGTLRTVRKVSAKEGGNLRAVFSAANPISASANGTFFGSASGTPFEPVLVTSNTVTITPSGGTSPYTYSWAELSSWGVLFSNSTAATTFIYGDFFPGSHVGSARCTVTDANTNSTTVDVPFQLLVSNI